MERAAVGTEGNGAGEMQSGFAEGRLCQMRDRAAGVDPGDVTPLPGVVRWDRLPQSLGGVVMGRHERSSLLAGSCPKAQR